MTREIKFRAWDKDNKKMCLVSDISLGDDGRALTIVFQTSPKGQYYRGLVHGENGILMQFTGMKDTHEKEIYEGDIIWQGLYDQSTGKKVTAVVDFQNYGYVLVPTSTWVDLEYAGGGYMHLMYHYPVKYEIIGNIHETPELLERK